MEALFIWEGLGVGKNPWDKWCDVALSDLSKGEPSTVQDVTTEVSIAPQTEEDYEAEVLELLTL